MPPDSARARSPRLASTSDAALLLEQVGRHAQGVVAHGPRRQRATSREAAWTRRASCSSAGVVTGSAYKHQVVAVDDQVGHVLGQLVAAAPQPLRRARRPAGAPGPWRRPCRRARRSPRRRRGRTSPSTATTPGRAAASGRPRPGHAWAPSSTTRRPEAPRAKAIHSLRADRRAGPGPEHGAHPRLARHRRRHDPGPAGVGDDRLDPGPGGDLGRRHLRGHAAAAHRRCRPRRPSARAGGRSPPPPRSARPRRTGGGPP